MSKALLGLAMISAAALGLSGCGEALVTEPESMTLEVVKSEVRRLKVSFTARVAAWDGEASIHYRALVCSPSGDLFICMGGPLVEDSVHASKVVQPISWTEQQCDYLVVFEASLRDREKAEATHVTCS